jgi:hypothetical protein
MSVLTEIVATGRPLRDVTEKALETRRVVSDQPQVFVRHRRLVRARRDVVRWCRYQLDRIEEAVGAGCAR